MRKIISICLLLVLNLSVYAQTETRITGFFGLVSADALYPNRFAYDNESPVSIVSAKLETSEYSRYSGQVGQARFYLRIKNCTDKELTMVWWVVTPYVKQRQFFMSSLHLAGLAGTKPGKVSEVYDKWESLFNDEPMLVQIEKVGFKDGSVWKNPALIDVESEKGPQMFIERFKDVPASIKSVDW